MGTKSSQTEPQSRQPGGQSVSSAKSTPASPINSVRPSSKSFSASDLSRRSGDVIAEAMRAPVTITQHKKPRLVLLSTDDYETLRRNADHRRAYDTSEVSDDVFDEIVAAMDTHIADPSSD